MNKFILFLIAALVCTVAFDVQPASADVRPAVYVTSYHPYPIAQWRWFHARVWVTRDRFTDQYGRTWILIRGQRVRPGFYPNVSGWLWSDGTFQYFLDARTRRIWRYPQKTPYWPYWYWYW